MPHLKKLDFRGCLVKVDHSGAYMESKLGGNKYELNSTSVKKIKKKALGKNYERVKWQDSPDTSDEERQHRKYAESSCESDNSEELEHTRKKIYKARADAKKKGLNPEIKSGQLRFDFDKDFLY